MSRRRSRSKSAPSYRLHKPSGQAIVSIGGKMHYLGRFDSPESHELYRRLLAEVWASDTDQPNSTDQIPISSDQGTLKEITILELAVCYGKEANRYYRKNGKPTSEWENAKRVLRELTSLYGTTLANEFGPLRFQAFRNIYIKRGCTRTTINKYMVHIKKMFQHAGKMELLPMECFWRIRDVGNLIQGRSDAREGRDVLPDTTQERPRSRSARELAIDGFSLSSNRRFNLPCVREVLSGY